MVTPRRFVLALGVIALIAGVLFLVLPASIGYHSRSYDCGTGLSGVSEDVRLADAGASIANAQGGFADEGTPRADACASEIKTRQLIGWPAAIVGAVVVAGAVLIRQPSGQQAPRTE